jgi:hypothetical protein
MDRRPAPMMITLFVPGLQVLHLVHGVWLCDNDEMECQFAFGAANPSCERYASPADYHADYHNHNCRLFCIDNNFACVDN